MRRVGTLQAAVVRALQSRDRRCPAPDAAAREHTAHGPRATLPGRFPIQPRHRGRRREPRGEHRVAEVTPHVRQECANTGVTAAQQFPHAGDVVVGERLRGLPAHATQRVEHVGALAARHRVQCADLPAARRGAGELERAEDRRLRADADCLDVAARRHPLRRATDATCIKKAGRIVVVEVARLPEGETVGVLEEERTSLGEEDLERREVHDGRIGFDLAEVRVDGRGERKRQRELHAEVAADGQACVTGGHEAVAGRFGLGLHLRAEVRHQLDARGRPQRIEADQVPEPRHDARRIRRRRRPERFLAMPRDLACEVDAPRPHRAAGPTHVVAQLRQRDAELCRPAGTVGARSDVPDGIPERIVITVV